MVNIFISGISGWMGRSAILASREFTSKEIKFYGFGSKEKKFSLHNQETYESQSLSKISHKYDLDVDLFLPFAFLTQEKVSSLGDTSYEKVNLEILNLTLNFIEKNRPHKVINLSSGVVSKITQKQKITGAYELYRKLKQIQEDKLEELCTKFSIPLVTCRVFSVTGIEVQDPFKYAFSNILIQSNKGKDIHLASKGSVFRRYVDAVDLIHILLKLANDNMTCKFESGGEKVEIFELTRIIQSELRLDSRRIILAQDSSSIYDDYFSRENSTEKYAERYGVTLKSLSQQIRNTFQAPSIQRVLA